MFVNDLFPRSKVKVQYLPTLVKTGASIGTNATILAGITIGEYAVVGAGAVVTHDVPDFSIYAGNPARELRRFTSRSEIEVFIRGRQPLAL
jgi:UDP-2-acetamido-3-amino-2,3-dideoxy-glucuronate N-acetyltransferase